MGFNSPTIRMILSAIAWFIDYGFHPNVITCTKMDNDNPFIMPITASMGNTYSKFDDQLVAQPSFCSVGGEYLSSAYVPDRS